MNPAIFGGNLPPSPFNIDSVTITRRSGTPTAFNMTTVFSGTADMQEGGGATYITPSGAAEQIDAKLFIDLASSNPLPVVKVDDIVTNTADGKTFRVVSVATHTFMPHLELMLKRGGLKYQGK